MTSYVDHEVARALALGRPHNPVGLLAQVVLQTRQGAWREAPVSHATNSSVAGWVHAEEQVLGGVARRVARIQAAGERGVGLHRPTRTPRDRRDVGVAGRS